MDRDSVFGLSVKTDHGGEVVMEGKVTYIQE